MFDQANHTILTVVLNDVCLHLDHAVWFFAFPEKLAENWKQW